MVDACAEYLKEKIRAVMGQNAPYYTRLKELQLCAESHVGSAIVDSDVLTFSGRPVRNTISGQDDRKLYDRTVIFNVILGEYKLPALSPLFEAFLRSLGHGFSHEGHYIALMLGEAGWVDRGDSIIKAEIAVEVPVIFQGGIYQPQTFRKLSDVSIEREDTYGN